MLLSGHTNSSRAINHLYPLEMPPCENEADNKSLESSSKQEQDETITDKKKAQQLGHFSIVEGKFFLFPLGMS